MQPKRNGGLTISERFWLQHDTDVLPSRAKRVSDWLREGCRNALAAGLHYTGLLRAAQRVSLAYPLRSDSAGRPRRARRSLRSKFGILSYHRVGELDSSLLSALSPRTFEAQIRYLRKRYRIVSLEQLCRELEDPQTSEHTLAVTFDDGYRDLYPFAFPILQEYRVPATIFLIVGSIETGEVPWYDRVFMALRAAPRETLDLVLDCPRRFNLSSPQARYRSAWHVVRLLRSLPNKRRRECCALLESEVKLPKSELQDRMLTWNQVRTMHDAGISFGSHTMTHPVVSRLDPEELETELLESKRIMEHRLNSPVRDFSFPFGKPTDCGPNAAAILSRCGYRSAVTTVWGINTPNTNPYALRRMQTGEDRSIAMFVFDLSRLFFHGEPKSPQNESQRIQHENSAGLDDASPSER